MAPLDAVDRRALSRRGFLAGAFSTAVVAGLAGCSLVNEPDQPSPTGLVGGNDRRYLLDKDGNPVFVVADTAWNVMAGLELDDAKRYLDTRREQGFNTVMCNLLPFNREEETVRGTAFENGDVTRPREEWFKGCDAVLDHATSIGLSVGLGLLWLKDNGGSVGGTLPSDDALVSYSRFVGERYHGRENVFYWVGGDDDPEKSAPTADTMGRALKAADPNALITFHTWYAAPMASQWPWLGFYSFQWNSNSSPYPYTLVRDTLAYEPRRPVFLMEPSYDPVACCGEDRDTSPQENRRAGWWAALSGAMGIAYGGPRNTWNAGADTDGALVAADLERPQARETAGIGRILDEVDWSTFEPDYDGEVLVGDRGTYGEADFAMAAKVADGSALAAYTPVKRDLTVDLDELAGPVRGRWFDPATLEETGPPQQADGGRHTFTNPLPEDAVLLVETV